MPRLSYPMLIVESPDAASSILDLENEAAKRACRLGFAEWIFARENPYRCALFSRPHSGEGATGETMSQAQALAHQSIRNAVSEGCRDIIVFGRAPRIAVSRAIRFTLTKYVTMPLVPGYANHQYGVFDWLYIHPLEHPALQNPPEARISLERYERRADPLALAYDNYFVRRSQFASAYGGGQARAGRMAA